jgi:hypothetical protein
MPVRNRPLSPYGHGDQQIIFAIQMLEVVPVESVSGFIYTQKIEWPTQICASFQFLLCAFYFNSYEAPKRKRANEEISRTYNTKNEDGASERKTSNITASAGPFRSSAKLADA